MSSRRLGMLCVLLARRALATTDITGCMEHGYGTYDETATIDDPRLCEGANACQPSRVDSARGACANCQSDALYGQCDAACAGDQAGPDGCGNVGFRHPSLDRIVARRVEKGAIRADGDLADWAAHPRSMRYEMPLFATAAGDVVMYENYNGGVWDGRNDFWVTARLAWDEDYLYLAIEVIDDDFDVNGACYKQGVQVAFEVGGDESFDREGHHLLGTLQAKRSERIQVSRLKLINLGLNQGQTACNRAPVGDTNAADDCCVNYESAAGGSWVELCGGAAVRDEARQTTTYELLFSKRDLIGFVPQTAADAAYLDALWDTGLVFGFSFLVNDGDDGSSAQRGWAGYYPHSIVHGKDANKIGTVLLDGGDRPPRAAADDAAGIDGASFALGMATLAGALACALGVFCFARRPAGCSAAGLVTGRQGRPRGTSSALNSVQFVGNDGGGSYVAPWQGGDEDI